MTFLQVTDIFTFIFRFSVKILTLESLALCWLALLARGNLSVSCQNIKWQENKTV